jgi:hypothetical protein
MGVSFIFGGRNYQPSADKRVSQHNKEMMKFVFYGLFLCATPSLFAFTEVGVEFSRDRLKYGDTKQNRRTTDTYSGTLAFYLFSYTAIEGYYSKISQTTEESYQTSITGSTLIIEGLLNEVETDVYGVGIRQAFAHPKARLRPLISFGYAKQKVHQKTTYTVRNSLDNSQVQFSNTSNPQKSDSSYASFSLQLKLTQMFSVSASVRSVFPSFEFARANENIRYSFGLTCAF